MKITCISDQHGFLPDNVPDGDVLVIAGDICPIENHEIEFQKWWLENRFNLWLDYLSYDSEHIICVCGNHDWVFQDIPQVSSLLHCKYLQDSSVIVDDVKFYGYPHTPKFCDWAFNSDEDHLKLVSDNIPDDTDVLLTHGPAYGILDVVTENCWDFYKPHTHLGCNILRKRIDEMPNLKLHVSGHIHSAHGIVKPLLANKNKTTFVNASYVNEAYQPIYNIITVDID